MPPNHPTARAARSRLTAIALLAAVVAALPAALPGAVKAAEPPALDRGALLDSSAGSSTASVLVEPVVRPSVLAAVAPVGLRRVASGLRKPLFVTGSRDGTSRLYIVEKGGRIRILYKGVIRSTSFLNISSLVSTGSEQGLLGLAFHPSYRTNGRFYVNYTDRYGDTVIAEYRRSSSSAWVASASSRRVILRIRQPYANHNGGMLAFGPDGYLYIATGDGGSSGDPGNRAQRLDTLLGKILRINVNARTSTRNYTIPSTNPFVGRTGARGEIWSFGLRNPFRFSFDRSTGDLWIGDVGQNRYEEVDRGLSTEGRGRGRNYGWRVMEGFHCYSPSSGCSTSGKTMPITEYSHDFGCSVTGGYVYRGSLYPALRGQYLFADYCSGRIWSLTAGGSSRQAPVLRLDSGHSISSFGQDNAGELYVTDLSSGEVFRIGA